MFEKSKDKYLTRGVDAEIPIALQVMMWQAVDQMPEPKDYLQVFSAQRRERFADRTPYLGTAAV